MTWHPSIPYVELPELPPAVDVETKTVLKAVIEARAAVAQLDQAARRMSNPTVLINSIPILEAQASSEIENIVTTTDELFRFVQDEAGASDPATKETLKYRSALFAGVELIRARPLTVGTAEHVCSVIKGRDMGVRKGSGTYIGNAATHEPIYTPPVGEIVLRDKLENWVRFINEPREYDPLVTMAIAHYQFEAIHPFEDGNGRTGRIVNVLMLLAAGLIDEPILYLSRYFIEKRDEYYRLLLAVTARAGWEEWVLFVLEGVRVTALSTLRKIDEIQTLQEGALATIRAVTTAGANADLLGVLFEQPYCRIASVVDRCGVSRPTATNWLNALCEAGVLVDLKVGRERLFINTRFLRILTRPESAPAAEPTLF